MIVEIEHNYQSILVCQKFNEEQPYRSLHFLYNFRLIYLFVLKKFVIVETFTLLRLRF